jgi:threonylcarbamoyladenosine tRNA methylthiotransferase MtaB
MESSERAPASLRVSFATLGCKVNQYDTATIETLVRQGGAKVVPFSEPADVCVVNTCSVTDRADAESRQLARRAKRQNPAARVVMTGCFAQTAPQAVARLPEVDYVVGIGRLADLLRAVRDEIPASEGRILVGDLRGARTVSTLGAEVFGGQTRAFLKVQEGCDLFCTFCIVPFARGRSRSVEPRRVLAELERLAERGFREVVLTGIHLGGYGQDLDPPIGLVDLVEMIGERAPVPRLRLSSVDPPEVTPRLLSLIKASDVLCPHLHMPVQSGADAVLRRMRRQYDRAFLADVLAEIGRTLPDGALGTDVIAGFPGETEKDFETTLHLVEASPFSYLHVFPYSRRSGTTAAKAKDPVAPSAVAERARELRLLAGIKRRAFAERFIGRQLRVLVEHTPDRETGFPVGYSRNYVRVLLPGGNVQANAEVTVRVMGRRGERVVAATSGPEHGDATPAP